MTGQSSASAAPTGLPRTLLAGFGGGAAWIAAMALLFGPAQAILADPQYQSAKFLAVFGQLEPLPRVTADGWLLPAALLALGVVFSFAYRSVRPAFAGLSWWRKGLRFGAVAWLLMVPWFEFYLPWNVMHEPASLVLLEGLLWLGVLLFTGLAIAAIQEWRRSPQTA